MIVVSKRSGSEQLLFSEDFLCDTLVKFPAFQLLNSLQSPPRLGIEVLEHPGGDSVYRE